MHPPSPSRLFTTLALGLALAVAASGAPFKLLTVNVWDVCDDSGANCAPLGPADDLFYAKEANAIWAQAGIAVEFLFGGYIENTQFLNINDASSNSFYGLTAELQSMAGIPTATTEVMFLVHTITGAFGESWLGYGGLAIAMDTVMNYASPYGRIDTVAHELGHNLGLGHNDASNSLLMASGGIRRVPTSTANVYPNGTGLDRLTATEIATALDSPLLTDIPEPSSILLVLTGTLGAFGLTKLRRP